MGRMAEIPAARAPVKTATARDRRPSGAPFEALRPFERFAFRVMRFFNVGAGGGRGAPPARPPLRPPPSPFFFPPVGGGGGGRGGGGPPPGAAPPRPPPP